MNKLFTTSTRFLTSRSNLFVARRIVAPAPSTSFILARTYATKKIVDTEVVTSDKAKRAEFARLLDEEITVLKATNFEDDTNKSLRKEVADRFLKESAFKMEEDSEAGTVKLTKTHENKIVTVTFSDREIEPLQEEEESEEEGTESEEAEEKQENEEEESSRTDHPFRVEITDRKGNVYAFNCFCSSDGSFIVSELNIGDGKRIPVQIASWSEDLQRELISWLEPHGVNERLSFFIHQYMDERAHSDALRTIQEFRQNVVTER